MRNLALGLSTSVVKSLVEFIPMRMAWGERGEGGKIGVTIDECVDFLFSEGHPKSKAGVEDMLDKLVAANIIRMVEEKRTKRYYRTMDFDRFTGESIRWKDEIEKSFDFVKEHYPEAYDGYVDCAWTYTDPMTGEEKEIPKESTPHAEQKRLEE